MIRPVRAALVLAIGAALAGAQTAGGDPRDIPDPREVPDPRGHDPDESLLDPREPPPFGEHVDVLLEREAYDEIGLLFSEDPWSILAMIEATCDRWMTLVESGAVESGAGRENAYLHEATARLLAELADETLVSTRFTAHVETVLAYGPEQIAVFRDGREQQHRAREILDEASSVDDALPAMTPLQRAIDRAREVSDLPGRCAALARLGEIQAAAGMTNRARATLHEARETSRLVKDLDSLWIALESLLYVALREGDRDAAMSALQDQWLLAFEQGDEEVLGQVREQIESLDLYFGDF